MPTKPTTLLILSDTHAHPTPIALSSLSPIDILLHCGDLTQSGQLPEHGTTLALLAAIPAELKLVIPGNHDFSLDLEFCRRHDAEEWHRKAVEIWTGLEAKAANVTFLSEGLHRFTLQGEVSFSIYASGWTPSNGGGWAFQHPSTVDAFAGLTAPDSEEKRFDIVMTRGPPAYLLDETSAGKYAGCEHLLGALRKAKPLLHCFGHIHEGFGAQVVEWTDDGSEHGLEAMQREWVGKNQMRRNGFLRKDATGLESGEQTLLVNASVLDGDHEPSNVPWVVELKLTLD